MDSQGGFLPIDPLLTEKEPNWQLQDPASLNPLAIANPTSKNPVGISSVDLGAIDSNAIANINIGLLSTTVPLHNLNSNCWTPAPGIDPILGSNDGILVGSVEDPLLGQGLGDRVWGVGNETQFDGEDQSWSKNADPIWLTSLAVAQESIAEPASSDNSLTPSVLELFRQEVIARWTHTKLRSEVVF
jgi:hypothetical protein